MKIKNLFDKNPQNTMIDKKQLVSILGCGKRETEIVLYLLIVRFLIISIWMVMELLILMNLYVVLRC